jgi:putative methylase
LNQSYTLGIEIDPDALNIAKENVSEMEVEGIDLMQGDIRDLCLKEQIVDTVVMNPPFGTKNNEGIDVLFLQQALRLSRNVVYSMHKTSTRRVGIGSIIRLSRTYSILQALKKQRYDMMKIDILSNNIFPFSSFY